MGRQAIHGILEGLVEEECVFTVQVDGALVMGPWLASGSIGGCQEVRQPVDSHCGTKEEGEGPKAYVLGLPDLPSLPITLLTQVVNWKKKKKKSMGVEGKGLVRG